MLDLTPQNAMRLLSAYLGGPLNAQLIAEHYQARVPQPRLAERYGLSEDAVQKRIARARRKLRAADLWPEAWD